MTFIIALNSDIFLIIRLNHPENLFLFLFKKVSIGIFFFNFCSPPPQDCSVFKPYFSHLLAQDKLAVTPYSHDSTIVFEAELTHTPLFNI